MEDSLITAFYQSRSIVFQFYLKEFFSTALQIKKIADDKSLENVKATFIILTGPNLFFWDSKFGILFKLKELTSTFANHDFSIKSKQVELEKFAIHLWEMGGDITNQMEKKFDSSIMKKIEAFIKSFQELTDLTSYFIKEFASDENIVLFIFKNREYFQTVFGNEYIKNLLNEVYPEGIHLAASLLKNKFIERGFELAGEQLSNECLALV